MGSDIQGELNDTLDYAKSLYLIGDYNHTLEVLNTYVTQNPENSSAWNLKGLVFLAEGSYDSSIDSFHRAPPILIF